MPVSAERFGTTPDGEEVDRFTLSAGAVRVQVLSYGGVLSAIEAPDRHGDRANVVLGFTDLADYVQPQPVLRLHHRPVRQPVGGRPVHAGRPDLPHPAQRRTQRAARRRRSGWTSGCGRWRRPATRRCGCTTLSHEGDQGFPGTLALTVTYTLDSGRGAAHRLRGNDRRADRAQPDQPQLLQPGRRGQRRRLRARRADRGRPVHAGRVPG